MYNETIRLTDLENCRAHALLTLPKPALLKKTSRNKNKTIREKRDEAMGMMGGVGG